MKNQVFENGVWRPERVVLITGAYGFIGSNLVNYWLQQHHNDKVILLDAMTYAARPEFTKSFIKKLRKSFSLDVHEEIVNIQDQVAVARVMQKYKPSLVLHLAAESHVCRSIQGPSDFMKTNVMGTFNLIEEFYQLHKDEFVRREGQKLSDKRFIHISTDEVFGELDFGEAPFSEETNITPRSPYSASKAASDHIVQCYWHTYGVPTIITNCSNNFGPNQHDEKLVPATIKRILEGEPIRIHGTGENVRDWLYVEDHVRALSLLADKGEPGERYCIGGEFELKNIEVAKLLSEMVSTVAGLDPLRISFEHTNDRPTDDRRYAINCSKLKQLGWRPTMDFHQKMADTINYYLAQWGREGAEDRSAIGAGVSDV